MVFRRHKSLLQAVSLLLCVGAILKFSYSYYQENKMKLKAANIRHHEILEERNRMSRELNGAIESKNSLEYSLRSKVQEFAKLKQDWVQEKRDMENGINRYKANFDALDSEHRMLKSKHDDLQIDYELMKKSFDRLKDDHSKVDDEHRKNFSELKSKNEKIILALQKQVEHYQKQENTLHIKVEDLQRSVAEYQTVAAKLQQQLTELQEGKRVNRKSTELKLDQTAPKPSPKTNHSKIRRRRLLPKGMNTKLHAKKTIEKIEKPTYNGDKKLEKVAENMTKGHQDKTDEVNNDVPRPGKYTVDGIQKDGVKKDGIVGVKREDRAVDNIEIIREKGKAETNFKLDKPAAFDAKDKQSTTESTEQDKNVDREKRDVHEPLNNDQKFDDQENALQEGEENEDNIVDEDNEENGDVLDEPDQLLLKEKSQDGEEVEG